MIQIDISKLGRLDVALEAKALVGAAKTVISQRTQIIKNALRRQIRSAGLGNRLANAVRAEVKTVGLETTGHIFSKAKVKRPGGVVDLITVFGEGATIRAGGGKFLAIPLPAAGKGPRSRRTPANFSGELVFIPLHGGRAGLLVRKSDKVPMFYLVRQTRLRKRLDIDAAVKLGVSDLDGRIAREFERRRARFFESAGLAA